MNEYVLFILSAAVSVVVNALGRLQGRAEPSRILVVKLDHLGDVILATPAIRALKERYPNAVIDVLVHPGAVAAVANHPGVHRVLTYRSPRFSRDGAADDSSRLREVARTRYDTIVELRGDGRTLLLPFRAAARRRVDRGTVRLQNKAGRVLGRAPTLHEVAPPASSPSGSPRCPDALRPGDQPPAYPRAGARSRGWSLPRGA